MTNITPEQKNLLDYMAKGAEYQAQVFSELSKVEYFTLLKDHSYFGSTNNPFPVESEKNKGFFSVPYWPALTYLEKISKDCSKSGNKEHARKLMSIIREVTRPDDKTKKVDNWRTWQSFVKIMAPLPSDAVEIKDIELIADWLDSKFDASMVMLEIGKTLLPNLLKESEGVQKVSRLIEIVLDSVKIENRHSLGAHSLQELFKINATHLGEKYGAEIVEILKKKIEHIVTEKDNAYSYMWRPAIEDSEQNISRDEYRHILISGLRDVFLAYASSQEASSIIESYFRSEKHIIRRFSLYITGQLFDKYKTTSEKIIRDTGKTIFLESNYHHELYKLIAHHFKQFSQDLQNSLMNDVVQLSGDWREDVDKEKLDAILRRRWLYAIKVSGYSIPNDLEEKYFKGIDYKPEHPEFLSYIGPVSWGDESLFSASELLAQGSINEIITFLGNFKGKNRFGETAIREAGQSLKEAIKLKQGFFENCLIEFKKSSYEYWYYVIQAFEELARDKKEINWDKVLEFCQAVVGDDVLWDGKEKESQFPLEPKKSWIPAAISDLIKNGVQNGDLNLTENNYKGMDNIIRALLDKQESTASGKDEDALTEAINTTKGHVLESFKSYVLRRYRDFEKLPDKGIKEKEDFWKTVEPLFSREIERTKEGNFEFSSLAGAYLPNLYYLHKDWIASNINNILPAEEKHWRCAMQGYSYVNTVYAVIYSLLKDNGHLKRALDTKFSNDQTKRRIIENVAVSYLRGQETIDGQSSLFKYILEKWNPDDIEEVISLFWAHRDAQLEGDQKERIFEFWRYCFNRTKGKEDENKDILSDLNLLAVFLDQLQTEHVDWLKQSAKYVEERYHSSFLLEYFDKLADTNSKDVGNVFLIMLEKSIPWYKQENIQSIVEKIYKAGFKNEIANPICDKYARAGFEFLTTIYKKYNREK
jgi:hypothetical protein